MSLSRLRYWRRVAASYTRRERSQLSFWWERPEVHPEARPDLIGPYYMTFADKARYAGPFDNAGVPMLDYHGAIGRQYNPIAIAQYGLARHNAWLTTGDDADRRVSLRQAEWLRANLRPNAHSVPVWMHDFDWEYAEGLRKPWYSGLAQGQGISCLVRAHAATGRKAFLDAAEEAFVSMTLPIERGGVLARDGRGDVWIEEYITHKPSHILNGFMWAIWGVHDLALATGRKDAIDLFERGARTIEHNLPRYDTGFWSLYDLVPNRVPCIASPFYHALHSVQLRVMHMLTKRDAFIERAVRWEGFAKHPTNRARALVQKALFKILYY